MTRPENQLTTIQPLAAVDMSPEAIDHRLRKVSQLYKLGMAIRKARTKDLGAVEALRPGGSNCSGTAQVD